MQLVHINATIYTPYICVYLLVGAHNFFAKRCRSRVIKRIFCVHVQYSAAEEQANHVQISYFSVWPSICATKLHHTDKDVLNQIRMQMHTIVFTNNALSTLFPQF